jgi:hypothetical protein
VTQLLVQPQVQVSPLLQLLLHQLVQFSVRQPKKNETVALATTLQTLVDPPSPPYPYQYPPAAFCSADSLRSRSVSFASPSFFFILRSL